MYPSRIKQFQKTKNEVANVRALPQDEEFGLTRLVKRLNALSSVKTETQGHKVCEMNSLNCSPEDVLALTDSQDESTIQSEDDSLETLIKKLVQKVNQNDISKEEIMSLQLQVKDIENYLAHNLFTEMEAIRTNITQISIRLYDELRMRFEFTE